ncbi:DNA polymerase III subunit gamma/tau [Aliidiomarina sedimenti]|uniref:DNA polymerase III subunit gamma/tau n=1 Tax=Aliidiomarina sedimenti TaxID=1933879 RepID=A0ABY0BXP2_9GAMM|nr:DNA polymerase III subunit gamma/tau [Aliidiomarina sedimenti]RUO28936.1 DNA polymerase III subunit gamma/tau [Aliidiomarina sedimenti]
MNYQVLARKWRPHSFAQVVGQQHVLQALSNALTNQRLHHAYLLTGTRGVGKTTIARILAKSLNCEQGISATPCGECDTCQEIDQGRYVDLLEIDAASRTKVEDTRELLDNVQYRPTRGRYKVYLIDEVHMLSRHSFNALLKTLEEPPEHVKFLLATTDPEKLPVTVLSRCLQFHLRALTREEISAQLIHILQAESLSFDAEAIQLLARAARGSMRDALSLTDQAIAQGNQSVELDSVRAMLGHIEGQRIVQLLQLIVSGDHARVLQTLREMQDKVPDIAVVLPELQNLLHQLALLQISPAFAEVELFRDQQSIQSLSATLSPELVQVMYRIVLEGRRELPHAVDAFSAVEMTLLRLLAFRPATMQEMPLAEASVASLNAAQANPAQAIVAEPAATQTSADKQATRHDTSDYEPQLADDDADEDFLSPDEASALAQEQASVMQQAAQQGLNPGAAEIHPEPDPDPEPEHQIEPEPEPEPRQAPVPEPQPNPDSGIASLMATREQLLAKKKAPEVTADVRTAAEIDAWSASVDGMQATGRLRQVLLHSVLEKQGDGYQLIVDSQQQVLCSQQLLSELESRLRQLVGDVALSIDYATPEATPFLIQQLIDTQRAQAALDLVRNDERIQDLVQRFNAELDESSVKPV